MTTTIGSLDLNALSDLYNDSNQYFWFEGDASATYGAGVHITLSPDTSFIANPTGQNILMNTDGISIRNGLLPMMTLDNDSLDFNVINTTTGTYNNVASFGSTAIVIGEEAKANLHLTFNNLSMVDKDGAKFFEVGDARNADGIATIKYTEIVTVNGAGRVIVTVNSNISSIVSVYADSVQLSSSQYSFSGKNVTINGLTADSKKTIKITYTTTESIVYLTFGERASSGSIGNYSVAEGHSVTSSGYGSHAEGSATTASGNFSHAEGSSTIASVHSSHAEGSSTTASEYCSHAEGNATTASGIFSHAEGSNTTASENSSHAGGHHTVADGFCMTAIGKYNTLNSGKAFAIGNGAGGTSRSDAFTVDWDGNTVMKGGLTLGTALSIANGGTGATTHTSNSVLTGNGTSALKNVASANGALYATKVNGAPKFGTLPIAQGGTGATTASNARSNLGIGNLMNYVSAQLSSDFALTKSYKQITLAEVLKNGSLFEISGGGVKCLASGTIEVHATAYLTSGYTANDIVNAQVYKNGTGINYLRGNIRAVIASPYTVFNINGFIEVTANDIITLYARNQTASRGNIGAGGPTKMDIKYIK